LKSSGIGFALFDSPLGEVTVVSRENRLVSLDITKEGAAVARKRLLDRHPGAVETAKPFGNLGRLLERFFRGEEVDFDVPFDLGQLGGFTRRVLLEVKTIPFGSVRSYREIGRRLGYPMAARAVGQAVGKNPIPIVIPCHRVIKSDGKLGGFSMGLSLKERLLALEGIRVRE